MLRRIFRWFSKTSGKQPSRGVTAAAPPRRPVRRCELCERRQVLHITLMHPGAVAREKHLCEACTQTYLQSIPPPNSGQEIAPGGTDQEKQILVEMVIISELHEQQGIVCRELGGAHGLSLSCVAFLRRRRSIGP